MQSNLVAAKLEQRFHDFSEKAVATTVKGTTAPTKRKKVKRTKEEIRRQQEQFYAKTVKEIDALLDDYNTKISREGADSIGAAYARFSSRFQDSIADQLRSILQDAVRLNIYIPRENVFFDLAVRGFQERRPGLLALREMIEVGNIQTLMIFTTARLYRRAYKCLQFVEEELVERGIRGIFVKSHIDTADGDNWRTTLQALANVDEAQVRVYGAHINASHEGLFDRQMVHTTLSLGYAGEIVEGEVTRRQRPRRRIVIDPKSAQWIVQIFYWYVVDRISIAEIARTLNADENAPAPENSITGLWTHALVRKHLSNPIYRGWWAYGATETKWKSKKDYAAQIPRQAPLREAHFDDLQIIPDECWHAAQTLLAAETSNSGRKPTTRDHDKGPRLLQGLFECPEHGRRLAAGGANGRVLLCPCCRWIEANSRPIFTHLNRKLALQRTCDHLLKWIRPSEELIDSVIEECVRRSAELQKEDPYILQALKKQAAELKATIDFNRRNPGVSEDEQRQTMLILKDLRRQQNDVLARLNSVEAAQQSPPPTPSREQVAEFLDATRELIQQGLTSKDESLLRKIRLSMEGIIQGKIEVQQMGERSKAKGWLQGQLRIDVAGFVVKELTGVCCTDSNTVQEVTIDFKKVDPLDEQSETAKRLWDDGLLHKAIAKQMDCSPSYVTKLIQHWHDKRGLPRPNNKRRRRQLESKQIKVPSYMEIANQVHELMIAGHSNLEIGKELGVSGTTVAKAIKWWHEKRVLPVPTAADRRQLKLLRAKKMLAEGMLVTDVAAKLDYSPRGLKLALSKFAVDNGEAVLDFRSRRGNAKAGSAANGKIPTSDERAA
ncbi:recombinase family protein [Bremerella sp. P1]|uniref:recombinase family protein n=1 Tax=Bremerella sp. P1 TaxID=3026424 RepID=UPI00236807D1|nr:recombinase family protein [Bremerella sp. P1]WDI42491.1 recombinase family protein [Bremerella sp. P1]